MDGWERYIIKDWVSGIACVCGTARYRIWMGGSYIIIKDHVSGIDCVCGTVRYRLWMVGSAIS